jgi:CubicO group peptidase (beta-lactamase class C family)
MGLAEDVEAVVAVAVAEGQVPGAAWRVDRGDEVAVGAAGTHTPGGDDAVRPDAVFRLSSVTKPVVAVAALALVEAGLLDLDGPVDPHLPEPAGPVVLADPADASAGTVPARRPITARDVLTFRLGLGMDVTAPWPTPTTALFEAFRAVAFGARQAPQPSLRTSSRSRSMRPLLRTSRRAVTTSRPPAMLSSVVYQNQANQSP